MSGKHGRKSENGLSSKILRTFLLLVLGIVILEGGAKPAEPSFDAPEVKESPIDPVQETKAVADNPLRYPLSLIQTRVKRAGVDTSHCKKVRLG